MALGDLDADGVNDLISTSSSAQGHRQLRIHWGTGDGRFSGLVQTPDNTAGAYPATVADLNLDGRSDVIAGVAPHPGETFALGNSFRNVAFRHAGAPPNSGLTAGPVTVGDFDDDGGPDIAYPNQGKMVVKTGAMPETTITSGPAGSTEDPTPTFSFSADVPGTTFECALDNRPWEPCASPFTVPPLAPGDHEFRVRAVGFMTDPTPAVRRITVLPPLSSGPPDGEADNEPALLELSVLRTRIPRSASGLVRHGAGGRVRCTADCVVHLEVIARGSAPGGWASPARSAATR